MKIIVSQNDTGYVHGNKHQSRIRNTFIFVYCSYQDEFPDRFIECFIAEQNLVGVAIGCATRDRTVAFVSTFAAFFSRAYDQIRMGAISQTNVNFVGSHCGVSIGNYQNHYWLYWTIKCYLHELLQWMPHIAYFIYLLFLWRKRIVNYYFCIIIVTVIV